MMETGTGVKHLQAKGYPKIAKNHQKLGRGEEGFLL